MIRNAELRDAKEIAEIYNYYIKETVITFETEEIGTEEMEKRIKKTQEAGYPFIVYEEDDKVTGYAYVGLWRERNAYKDTLETSIYIDKDRKTRGTGRKLYKKLIKLCAEIKVHVLIGVLSYPNLASQRLHESLGFEKVGCFKEVGKKFGKFVDVEFWSLTLKEGK